MGIVTPCETVLTAASVSGADPALHAANAAMDNTPTVDGRRSNLITVFLSLKIAK